MAFSTQKDFLKIAFLNNRLEPVCSRKPGVKLKSYLSSTDSRAWAMSKEKQAHFLADLIACRNYVDGDYDGSGGDASGGAASGSKHKKTDKDDHAERDVGGDIPCEGPCESARSVRSAKSTKSTIVKESSTNIRYLQNQVGDLRQENANLKQLLSDMQKNCTCNDTHGKENMKAVIEERDKLKDQLSKMIGMEDKIAMLRKRAAQADCLEKELKSCRVKLCDLQKGSQCAVEALNCLAQKKDSLQTDSKLLEQCQAEKQCLKSKLGQLECQLHGMCSLQEQNEELCEQLKIAQCQLQKSQCIEQELINTRKRLCRSEQALEDYECQLHELMDVIEELESQKNFCCCGGEGGVGGGITGQDAAIKDGHIQDLVTASKLTLDLVNVEFAARAKLQEKLTESISKIETLKEEMSRESARIQQTSDSKIAELMKKLKDCKAENDTLKAKNDELSKTCKDTENKINEARENIRKSIQSIGRSDPRPDTVTAPEPALAPAPILAAEPAPASIPASAPAPISAAEPAPAPTIAPAPTPASAPAPGPADKCCDEAKQLREDLNKEKALWENKLKDMTALYEKAKDDVAKAKEEVVKAKADCEKSRQSGDTAVEIADKFKKEKGDAEKEIKTLNDVLNEQKDMLAAAKGELEKHRSDLTKCNEKVTGLENEIGNLKNGNAELSKQLKDKENELAALNGKVNDLASQLAACQQKLKASTDSEAALKNQYDNLNKAMNDCKAEMNRIKDSKGGVDTAIAAKDTEIKAAIGNLDKCKADLEALRKQLQDKINGLQAEKDALEKEVAANKAQLGQLGKLVSDIEAERAKNKKLEGMVNDFENQLKAVPKEVPKVGGGQEGQLSQAIDQLKTQLASETAKVNDLAAQLAKCQQALAAKNAAAPTPPPAAAPQTAAAAPPPASTVSPSTAEAPPPATIPLSAAAPAVSQAMRAADLDKAASLAKIQNIHDNEKKDLSMNYDQEIAALKVANQALRDSLTKLKQGGGAAGGAGFDMAKLLDTLEQLKKCACKCGQKKKCLTKLERICQKIIDLGIECLDIKELTYLHSEVYKAGLRLKPELVASENKNQCCKCTGFTCCLPSVPKDTEMKLINRILSLEREVEGANELLLRFKECSAKKTTPCKSGRSEKFNAFRDKDEINEFLKLSKNDDKACGSAVRELYRKAKRNCKPKRDDSGRRCD